VLTTLKDSALREKRGVNYLDFLFLKRHYLKNLPFLSKLELLDKTEAATAKNKMKLIIKEKCLPYHFNKISIQI
jgi:hypothetical protein